MVGSKNVPEKNKMSKNIETFVNFQKKR